MPFPADWTERGQPREQRNRAERIHTEVEITNLPEKHVRNEAGFGLYAGGGLCHAFVRGLQRECARQGITERPAIVQTDLNRLAAAAANLYRVMRAGDGAEQWSAIVHAAHCVLTQSVCFQARYGLEEC